MPDESVSKSELIRQRWRAGEGLSNKQVMDEFGVSTGLLSQVKFAMEKAGHRFRTEIGDDGTTVYTLVLDTPAALAELPGASNGGASEPAPAPTTDGTAPTLQDRVREIFDLEPRKTHTIDEVAARIPDETRKRVADAVYHLTSRFYLTRTEQGKYRRATDAEKRAAERVKAQAKAKPAEAATPQSSTPTPVVELTAYGSDPTLPAFGSTIRVTGLLLDDDEKVLVRLQNGNRAWNVPASAFAEQQS